MLASRFIVCGNYSSTRDFFSFLFTQYFIINSYSSEREREKGERERERERERESD